MLKPRKMKDLLNRLFERFFKKQVGENKAIVEIPVAKTITPAVTTIVFKEPLVTCKCNCGNNGCKCDINCSCENCGCKCDSNCACKNKKETTKKPHVKKQPVKKQPVKKQPAKKQPTKKVDNIKNKPKGKKK